MTKETIRVYDPRKEIQVTIGWAKDGVFHHRVKPEHFCNKHQAFGLQYKAIDVLRDKGVTRVLIHHWLGHILSSDLADWAGPKAIVDDLGNGKQRFLPIKWMEDSRMKDQPELFPL